MPILSLLRSRLSGWLCYLLLLVSTACAAQPEAIDVIETLTPEITPSPSLTPQSVLDTTPIATDTGPRKLVVWLPDTLVPPSDPNTSALLSRQITAFETADGNVVVDARLKRAQDAGGILATLRSAVAVAPNALPDLTLMRRDDMIAAANAGLLQPLDALVSPAIKGDMYAAALALGQANGQLYGLPYALDVQHMAYLSDEAVVVSSRYEDFLAAGVSFVFPAGRTTGMSDVLLVQYVSAGGTLVDGGVGTFNAEALLSALTFFQQARDAGLIGPGLLEYTTPGDYQQQLAAGNARAGVVTARMYLTLVAGGQTLQPGYIPTNTGQPVTVVDGWMWVLTTKDASRQALAVELLDWLMDAERQGEYTRLVHFIPSQRSAVLRRWEGESYAAFINELLTGALLPLSEGTGQTARAMQTALVAVISGQRSAEESVEDVSAELGG